MIAASFTLTLQLQGPILTQSTTSGRFGLDAVMARSGDHFYLPGSLVKGLIGEAWQELACVDRSFETARTHWLGQASAPHAGSNEPARGMLFFEDLLDRTTDAAETAGASYRIAIDEERGAVQQGHYLVIEAPYRPGDLAVFTGTLWLLCATSQEAGLVLEQVQTAVRWIAAAGAERSVGFGRVLEGTCGPLTTMNWQPHRGTSSAAFTLTLTFTQPLCFAGTRVADNLFESERWITGAALKGALATLLAVDTTRWPTLRRYLHAVRFTHAFPALTGQGRPVVPPDSLVKAKGSACRDALFVQEARLLDGRAPAFSVDWKDDADVEAAFGWPMLRRELRVRNAYDGDLKRAGDGELFAYRMIVPDGLTWHASVLLEGIDAAVRPAVANELHEALQHGLFALGKTKARAAVSLQAGTPPAATVNGDHVALTLQTAALLCDPSRHLAPHGETGATDRDAMWQEYVDVWRDLSAGALALENYFHRQSLAGGGYLRHRFQHGEPYRPYLLTDAGSVFLLRVKDRAVAQDCVTRWLGHGLPLSTAVKDFYALAAAPGDQLWRHCPFVPENGFGEIAVDLHAGQRPGVEVWHV